MLKFLCDLEEGNTSAHILSSAGIVYCKYVALHPFAPEKRKNKGNEVFQM